MLDARAFTAKGLVKAIGVMANVIFALGATASAIDHSAARIAYASAIASLRHGDCTNAIRNLREYKKLALSTLARHPSFAKQVDDQIRLCEGLIETSTFRGQAW